MSRKMKQHITPEQLSELSDNALFRLHSLCMSGKYNWDYTTEIISKESDFDTEPMKYTLPLLSIGQMIEFLEDSGNYLYSINTVEREAKRIAFIVTFRDESMNHALFGNRPKLCDALWEAVKEVLEK